ncbi:hypothetical protein PYW07_013725 [Mythimna separata]|uniref:Uncharacterized protein n=1 Tax=Mythimna separata TaxID=271217 RepID=A0AAD7YG61_MYTSE|nr:hypothetical protein PYW07_013725 [Mythimna separata]
MLQKTECKSPRAAGGNVKLSRGRHAYPLSATHPPPPRLHYSDCETGQSACHERNGLTQGRPAPGEQTRRPPPAAGRRPASARPPWEKSGFAAPAPAAPPPRRPPPPRAPIGPPGAAPRPTRAHKYTAPPRISSFLARNSRPPHVRARVQF